VHNIQPWALTINKAKLTIGIASLRKLEFGDPTGRETWISIGCMVQNIIAASPCFGLKATIANCDYKAGHVEINFLELGSAGKDTRILETIKLRHSSRQKLRGPDLSQEQKVLLNNVSKKHPNISVFITIDKDIMKLVAGLTAQAIRLALSIPGFKNELGDILTGNLSAKPTGIPGYAMGYGLLQSYLQPLQFKYTSVANRESKIERTRIMNSAGLIILAATGDVAADWLSTGQVYEQIVLLLTGWGYSHSTTAAVVEAPDFHQELEAKLGTSARTMAIIRYGKSNAKFKHTPRLPLSLVANHQH